MTFIKSLFLLLIVALAAPASATVFLPVDINVNGVDCSVIADKDDGKKEGAEEEEPDCE